MNHKPQKRFTQFSALDLSKKGQTRIRVVVRQKSVDVSVRVRVPRGYDVMVF